jgi:hypothetical protein
MMRVLAIVAALVTIPLAAVPAGAQDKTSADGAHRASAYYHRAPQVRGFVQRRGGYSYSSSDVVNTWGNGRSLFGSTNTYRNPYLDLQSRSGPFDHGFFFDSGVSPRGGNSPYQN